jgi:hypothetical protein
LAGSCGVSWVGSRNSGRIGERSLGCERKPRRLVHTCDAPIDISCTYGWYLVVHIVAIHGVNGTIGNGWCIDFIHRNSRFFVCLVVHFLLSSSGLSENLTLSRFRRHCFATPGARLLRSDESLRFRVDRVDYHLACPVIRFLALETTRSSEALVD